MNIESTHTRRSARPITAQMLTVTLFVSSLWTSAVAQDAEELAEQQIEVMRQYMEAAGVDPSQMGDAEAIMRSTAQQVAAKEAAENEQAAQEFETRTTGLGTARIEVGGNSYEYQISKCETGQGENGNGFRIEAQRGHNERDGMLRVTGDSHYNRVALQLTNRDGFWEGHSYPLPEFDGKRFRWTGDVDGDGGKSHLSMDLNCAEEQ